MMVLDHTWQVVMLRDTRPCLAMHAPLDICTRRMNACILCPALELGRLQAPLLRLVRPLRRAAAELRRKLRKVVLVVEEFRRGVLHKFTA